jgi:hypothetical protein
MALEDRPQRIRDLAGGERSRGDLIRERLEQVEVPSVDEGHFDRRSPKLSDGLESAKAAADDDHSVDGAMPGLVHLHRKATNGDSSRVATTT